MADHYIISLAHEELRQHQYYEAMMSDGPAPHFGGSVFVGLGNDERLYFLVPVSELDALVENLVQGASALCDLTIHSKDRKSIPANLHDKLGR